MDNSQGLIRMPTRTHTLQGALESVHTFVLEN